MANYNISTNKLAIAGLMTSITCILGPLCIAIPISPVPISLGLFGILLTTCLLGAKLGTLCCSIYLLLGFIGLPVFSGFTSGPGVLMGPTGGYLAGYLLVAALSDLFTHRQKGSPLFQAAGIFCGLFLCYGLGSLWLSHSMKIRYSQALLIGVTPYILFDFVKILLAIWLGRILRKRLTKAGLL